MKHLPYAFVCILIYTTAPLAQAKDADGYLTHYGALLSKYVRQGEKQGIKATLVDYASWGKDPLHKKALDALLQVNPEALSGEEKMAFWINAYNLLTIDLITKTGEEESIKNQGSLFKNVWKMYGWKIHGKRYTLDEIEHTLLRPMGDPRIHVAINCASLSCPDLRMEPYTVKKLNDQLDEQAQLFAMNQSKAVAITNSGLKISKIFKWFADDFGDEKGAVAFIHTHLPQAKHVNKIDGYFDYNWSLNSK
jgi:hypothetical protein